MKNLLIVGNLPPKKGGVSVHISRLLWHVDKNGIDYDFYNLHKFQLLGLIKRILLARVVHGHATNSLFAFLLTAICYLIRKRIVLTIHQDLGRYGVLSGQLIRVSIKLADRPIVLNNSSFHLARGINKKTVKLSSFFSPQKDEFILPPQVVDLLSDLRIRYKYLYCTNASDLSFNKEGVEIYGISLLLEIFSELPNLGLIISDSSGKNLPNFYVPPNIRFISMDHSFLGVIAVSDCYIRATATDGDSISLREALYLGKNVIASDCVDRPEGVILYRTNSVKDLKIAIFASLKMKNSQRIDQCAFGSLQLIYKSLCVV